MFRRAALRCAVVVLRFGRTVAWPPRGPRFVCAARRDDERWATLSSSDTSMPWRFAADTIFRRALSFADADSNAVWFQRAIALRTCVSSFSGRWPSPRLSTYAKTSLFIALRCFSLRSAIFIPPASSAAEAVPFGRAGPSVPGAGGGKTAGRRTLGGPSARVDAQHLRKLAWRTELADDRAARRDELADGTDEVVDLERLPDPRVRSDVHCRLERSRVRGDDQARHAPRTQALAQVGPDAVG